MSYTLVQKQNTWDCIIIDQLTYFKLFSFLRTTDFLEEKFIKRRSGSPLYGLFQLIFLFIICSHITGIGWHLINQYEIYYDSNSDIYLYLFELANTNWHIRYINCFYWSLHTMIAGGVRVKIICQHIIFNINCLFLKLIVFKKIILSFDFSY
jgi:hypothetical protein